MCISDLGENSEIFKHSIEAFSIIKWNISWLRWRLSASPKISFFVCKTFTLTQKN